MQIHFVVLALCGLATNPFISLQAQVKWMNVDAAYAPLPKGFRVFRTLDSLDLKPFIAYYAIADLKRKKFKFTTDTTEGRRLTPANFFIKSGQPLLVVNTTFFSFASNKNLNLVISAGKILSYNTHTVPLRGKDTLRYKHPFSSAIGISKKRKADIAWTYTDSTAMHAFAAQNVSMPLMDSTAFFSFNAARLHTAVVDKAAMIGIRKYKTLLQKWKMYTAVGGGPVLVQDGKIKISNNEEMKFAGNAIYDKHPRTVMGYTANHKLIVMVIEGRNPGKAEGATLTQAAQLMADLGCIEALNLDGGGSSCMLINGKETIMPSDKGLQRAIPAVFIIKQERRKR